MIYKHGIEVAEIATSFPNPLSTRYGVQVVFGTAPVNLAKHPAVNKPVKAATFEAAVSELGYSDDWENYTLCQSMQASYQLFQVNPVVFVNVLDPARHTKILDPVICEIKNRQAIVKELGILTDTVTVAGQLSTARTGKAKAGESAAAGTDIELENGKDYIMDFNDCGQLVITVLSTGTAYDAERLTVTCKCIAPEMVTEEDMIGACDVETGNETGFEVLRQIYPMHGVVPGTLLAPGWSQKPNIGAALQAKCVDISGAFRCTCILDIDTALAKKYTDCEQVKKDMGYDDERAIVLWPMLTAGGKTYSYSAVYGAMMSHNTAANNDVPYLYPSNKELHADGAVLEDGTEILLDQVQAGILNGAGVVTAFRDLEWKSFGNNMGCYPENTDPKDRWIGCRRMFDYVANYFVVEYRRRLDGSMNRRLVDDILNSFNIWGNSLTAAGMCAGLRAEYRQEENTLDDILSGHLKLRICFAPFTPAEYINALMEFDVAALKASMDQEG